MYTTAWTKEEDQLLEELLRQNLGARFKDIGEIATREGGPLHGRRTSYAVQGRLSMITGRSASRIRAPKPEEAQLAIIDQLQTENENLKKRNANLAQENARLTDKLANANENGRRLCWAIINLQKRLNALAIDYKNFFSNDVNNTDREETK